MLLLHSGGRVAWNLWHFEPSVIGLALIIIGLYVYTASRTDDPPSPLRIAAFLAGAGMMVVALVSPLHDAADRLLSMHMLQHVFLTTLGPPLVLLGLSAGQLRPLFTSKLVGAVLQKATLPVFAGTLFILNMWFWHVPPIYESAVNHLSVHITMHIAFMATGLLFWWPVIRPLPEFARMGEGGRLLYLFVTGFPMELQALLLIASGGVIYSFYDQAPHLWGVSPMADQQIAGLVMGAIGQVAAFTAISLLFFRYIDHEEQPLPPVQRPIDAA